MTERRKEQGYKKKEEDRRFFFSHLRFVTRRKKTEGSCGPPEGRPSKTNLHEAELLSRIEHLPKGRLTRPDIIPR
jgi:hypothetical protein